MKLQRDKENRRESTNLHKLDGKIRELENRIVAIEPVIGSWVPRIRFGTSDVGITYSTQLAYYYKVGRLVFLWGRIVLSSKGSVSGTAYITNLPFNILDNSKFRPIGNARLVRITFADVFMLEGVGGENTMAFSEVTNAGTRTVLGYNDFSDTSAVSFNLIYLTD